MSSKDLESLKIKAKLLQKAKMRSGKPFALKDAFKLLAQMAGFTNWRELKKNLESTVDLCPPKAGAYWKTWYSSYEQALQHWQTAGGFLLPYKKQFFVCDAHYIAWLGVAEDDADLEKVGKNWAAPLNLAAWQRLLLKIQAHQDRS